jgi:hypothetical protein
MEIENYLQKEVKRKKFFSLAGKSLLGYMFVSSFPFNLFFKKEESLKPKIKVTINPLAVQRKKIQVKNVR